MDKETSTIGNIESLENFAGWDSPTDEKDFFSEIDTENNIPEKTEPEDKEKKEDKEEETSEKVEKKEEKDFFEEKVPSENIEEEEEKGSEKQNNIEVLNFLKDKGLVDFEPDEGEELTEDKASELIDEKFGEAVDKRVEDLFEDLPDFVKQINKYALNGGDVGELLKNVAQTKSGTGITEDMDLEDEDDQETVVREMLKQEDSDDEEIETQLEFLKETGKLQRFAEKKFNKWKEINKKKQKQLIEQQEEFAKAEKEKIKQEKKRIANTLSEKSDIGGLNIDKKVAKDLPSFINDKTVKLQNGAYITQMQKELFYDIPQNEEAFLQLATLLKNRNEDGTFNFDSIAKNIKTKIAKEVRNNIRRNKTSIPTKSKTANQQMKRSLADFFNA